MGMTPAFWLDAQLSPSFALWLTEHFNITVHSVRDLGLLYADDETIFEAARKAGVIVITKDRDFAHLVQQFGSPPQVVWLRCGNTSNARLREIFSVAFSQVLDMLRAGEPLVEINI